MTIMTKAKASGDPQVAPATEKQKIEEGGCSETHTGVAEDWKGVLSVIAAVHLLLTYARCNTEVRGKRSALAEGVFTGYGGNVRVQWGHGHTYPNMHREPEGHLRVAGRGMERGNRGQWAQ